MAKIKQISTDLYNTLLDNEHIVDVHFTAEGEHFFEVKELKDSKGKGTGRFFGNLKTEIKQVERHLPNGGVEKKSKFVQTANTKYEIVETLSREECLELETFEINYTEVLNPAKPYMKRRDKDAGYVVNSNQEDKATGKRTYNRKGKAEPTVTE